MNQGGINLRYRIIDFNHLAYKTYNAPRLSADILVGDVPQHVDTTIPNFTIKDVFRYSRAGKPYILANTAVCLEGGSARRKEHFEKGFKPAEDAVTGEGAFEYKGGRSTSNTFHQGINLAVEFLLRGGVSLYRKSNHEADDMVASLIHAIKATDTTTPIDIITNDSDLLPYVDEQVSVYYRSKIDWSDEPNLKITGYYRVTKDNWGNFVKSVGSLRDYHIPYNAILLHKIIKGDKTDNIEPAVKKFGKVAWNKLIHQMEIDGVDFPNIFRYGLNFNEVIAPVMLNYFSKEQVEHMGWIYEGMDHSIVPVVLPNQISLGKLQLAISMLKINLPNLP